GRIGAVSTAGLYPAPASGAGGATIRASAAGKSGIAAVTVTAAAPSQTPFGGTPISVGASAATIQAEDFDNGGEGIAFHDVDAGNTGGAYRSTGVDLGATVDTAGGYQVGWVSAGEWLEYTINVAAADQYTIAAREA